MRLFRVDDEDPTRRRRRTRSTLAVPRYPVQHESDGDLFVGVHGEPGVDEGRVQRLDVRPPPDSVQSGLITPGIALCTSSVSHRRHRSALAWSGVPPRAAVATGSRERGHAGQDPSRISTNSGLRCGWPAQTAPHDQPARGGRSRSRVIKDRRGVRDDLQRPVRRSGRRLLRRRGGERRARRRARARQQRSRSRGW